MPTHSNEIHIQGAPGLVNHSIEHASAVNMEAKAIHVLQLLNLSAALPNIGDKNAIQIADNVAVYPHNIEPQCSALVASRLILLQAPISAIDETKKVGNINVTISADAGAIAQSKRIYPIIAKFLKFNIDKCIY